MRRMRTASSTSPTSTAASTAFSAAPVSDEPRPTTVPSRRKKSTTCRAILIQRVMGGPYTARASRKDFSSPTSVWLVALWISTSTMSPGSASPEKFTTLLWRGGGRGGGGGGGAGWA